MIVHSPHHRCLAGASRWVEPLTRQHPTAASHVDQQIVAEVASYVDEVNINAARMVSEPGCMRQLCARHDSTRLGAQNLQDGDFPRIELSFGVRRCVVHLRQPRDGAFPVCSRNVSGSLRNSRRDPFSCSPGGVGTRRSVTWSHSAGVCDRPSEVDVLGPATSTASKQLLTSVIQENVKRRM